MCGIAGALANTYLPEVQQVVQSILNGQQARGPDHQAILPITTPQLSLILGHNRLSIVDLSEAANQPLWDCTGRYCIVFNGEIYNYLELRAELIQYGYNFQTQSDTEVILYAFSQWGIECINYLNGAFAFAIFDKVAEELWLVRDRFGKKPLYYLWENGIFYFSSLPTVLAKQFKLAPNLEYVARGLKYWVYEDASDITPYQKLQQLPAAHYLQISKQFNFKQVRYYDLAQRVITLKAELTQLSPLDNLHLLAKQFEQAVQIRLRADVPIGISLSGGLDSSAVVALAKQQNKQLIGFTFGHPTAKETEAPLVAELSQQLGLEVDYVWPEAKNLTAALLPVLKTQAAPFASVSIIAQNFVYQRARERGIKVLLGGQGGDEAFMGYRKYQLFLLQHLLHKKSYAAALQYAWQLLPLLFAEITQIKRYWQARQRYQNQNNLITQLILPQPQALHMMVVPDADPWYRQLRDVTDLSLPTLLRYEDRNSLGNSVESRLPLMDYRLVELGLALPESLKLRKGYGKWALREIMQDKIPESIRSARYKRGFDVGMARFIQGGLGTLIRDTLAERQVLIKDYLPKNVKLTQLFTNEKLLQQPTVFAEAITLLWLSEC